MSAKQDRVYARTPSELERRYNFKKSFEESMNSASKAQRTAENAVASAGGIQAQMGTHIADKANPHGVTAAQVGARPDTWMPTAEQVGAIPNTWKPSASDFGAAPDTHILDANNPHAVTKTQVGLGNVPNVATNDQTPTFTSASTLATLTSGEKLSIAFGKIAKAITDLISHIGNKTNPHGVTSEQVGARPNTWMPTAEQVGARPDTWMPTVAEIGAAPNGFGYGDPMIWLGFDPVAWAATSTFQADLEAAFAAMPQGGCMQVQFVDANLNTQKFAGTIWKYTSSYGFLTADNYSGVKAIKTFYGGTWNPWEWENPPMVLGKEYRTTKRHNGNPVYTVAVDLGTLPNTSSKTVNLPYKTPKIISMQGVITNGTVTQKLPSLNYSDGALQAILQIRAVYAVAVKTFCDMSSYTGIAIVEYTK